jgi:hypothetical protein
MNLRVIFFCGFVLTSHAMDRSPETVAHFWKELVLAQGELDRIQRTVANIEKEDRKEKGHAITFPVKRIRFKMSKKK